MLSRDSHQSIRISLHRGWVTIPPHFAPLVTTDHGSYCKWPIFFNHFRTYSHGVKPIRLGFRVMLGFWEAWDWNPGSMDGFSRENLNTGNPWVFTMKKKGVSGSNFPVKNRKPIQRNWAFSDFVWVSTPQDDVEDVEFQLELPSSTVDCTVAPSRCALAMPVTLVSRLHYTAPLSSLAMGNPPWLPMNIINIYKLYIYMRYNTKMSIIYPLVYVSNC